MKKVMIAALVLAAQSAQSASMEGSKTAVTAAAPADTSASQSPHKTIMDSIAWLQAYSDQQRYCNSIIAMRGMIHNHPKLAANFLHKPSPIPTSNPDYYCYVANVMLGSGPGCNYTRIAADSLKQTPLTTPAGCDGTACRKLLDNAKEYLIEYCCDCCNYHGITEHCSCHCDMRWGNAHDSEKCPKENTATLYIDKLVASDVAARKQRAADAEYYKKQDEEHKKLQEEISKAYIYSPNK